MIFNMLVSVGGVEMYNVTVQGNYGHVDKNEASEGETVTVTTPNEPIGKGGYRVDVKNTATSAIIYTQTGLSPNETYAFMMPAADVTVVVSAG